MEIAAAAAAGRQRENADELTWKLWWSIFFYSHFYCVFVVVQHAIDCRRLFFFFSSIFSSSSLLLSYSNIFDGWWRMNYNRNMARTDSVWRGIFVGLLFVGFCILLRFCSGLFDKDWTRVGIEITKEVCFLEFLLFEMTVAGRESVNWSKRTHSVRLFYHAEQTTENLQFTILIAL